MVVATQQQPQRPLTASTDSLARSLHKEIEYSPLNVSRRSPDFQDYPGSRKRQNTVLDTGWYACFKNNNYVFVRNNHPDRQWKENNNSDITYIISSTTSPTEEGKDGKLVVSLQDPKPKVSRYSPPPVCDETPTVKTTNNATLRRSDKKKTPNWLKRLKSPGRSKSVKEEKTDELTPIIGNGDVSDESPEVKSPSLELPELQDQEKQDTPVTSDSNVVLRGPQTSTPKDKPETISRKTVTPYRPTNGRLSVRRRLLLDSLTPKLKARENLAKAFTDSRVGNPKVPISPIKKTPKTHAIHGDGRNATPSQEQEKQNGSQDRTECSKDVVSITTVSSPPVNAKVITKSILRRASTVQSVTTKADRATLKRNISAPITDHSHGAISKRHSSPVELNISPVKSKISITESKGDFLQESFLSSDEVHHYLEASVLSSQKSSKTNNILHPSTSNMDIPFADLEEDVSFDDRRSRQIRKQKEMQAKSSNDISAPISSPKDIYSSPIKSKSVSDTALKIRTEAPMSPMEQEENTSLNEHAKKVFSPDDPTVTFSPYAPAKISIRESPISRWLKEIRLLTESECLNALQAKELMKEDWIPNALAVGNAQETAEKIWEQGVAVQNLVEDMLEAVNSDDPLLVPHSLKVAQFCSSLVQLLGTSQHTAQAETKVRKVCSDLLETVNKSERCKEWRSKVKNDLEVLQKITGVIINQLLLRELHVIVDCVERADNINNMKRAVFAVILLGRLDTTFCQLMSKLGVVRSLLAICIEDKWAEMHPCALRALTVLTGVPTAIKDFENCGGVECVCDVLCDLTSSEGARSEAAGLVAQITAPWTEGSGYVLGSIARHSDRFVQAIAQLASCTDNNEVFLLSSAALANLSFADTALLRMKEHKVLEILVVACRNKTHTASLFIKDQVATVLANMASRDECRDEVCHSGTLSLLLQLLQISPQGNAPQLAACERIQQKAAIALARLCAAHPRASDVVARMQGIQRLVKLCKDRSERNDSDSVLVACLAALRKIAAVRQKEEFDRLGAKDLIEPRLWDAFLANSSKRESYV